MYVRGEVYCLCLWIFFYKWKLLPPVLCGQLPSAHSRTQRICLGFGDWPGKDFHSYHYHHYFKLGWLLLDLRGEMIFCIFRCMWTTLQCVSSKQTLSEDSRFQICKYLTPRWLYSTPLLWIMMMMDEGDGEDNDHNNDDVAVDSDQTKSNKNVFSSQKLTLRHSEG